MDITFVYFIYGLAFFSMGLGLFFESTRSHSLAESQVLRPLALFGVIHGAHEWMEMFIDKTNWVAFSNPELVGWLRIIVLTVSFNSLFVFGLLMLQPDRRLEIKEMLQWFVIGALSVAVVFALGWAMGAGHSDRMSHLDVAVRYLVAVPGGILAGIGLWRRADTYRTDERVRLGGWLYGAAIGLLLYSLTQLVVPPLDVFPASRLNTTGFLAFAGFPIQILRAATAILITICLTQVVGVLERNRQTQFLAAQEARMEALEQLQDELLGREAMRQDLLRHIVMAQEDERARISRELHDETSQTLTAFTFHLAVLRQAVTRSPKAREQIEYLQNLSRQMSQGIYRLVRDLRPAQLDDLGLVAALQYLVDEQEKRTGLQVDLRTSGEKRRLDSLVETVLFRVAQEALTNVARHSGVQQAAIHLAFATDQVALQVEDHGCGFDISALSLPTARLGLAGMNERVESIGGRLMIDSAPGRGTRVEVQVQPQGPGESAGAMLAIAHKHPQEDGLQ